MWIKSITVDRFLGRAEPLELEFNQDLNIITGRNGAGKTGVLKLIWYIISGNILEALREVVFDKVTLVTSEYTCVVDRISQITCKIRIRMSEEDLDYEDFHDEDGDPISAAEDQAASVLIPIGRSIFLPTFRRIEGGFTLRYDARRPPAVGGQRQVRPNNVEEALDALSRRLSHGDHTFVAAMSTVDIVGNLSRYYTETTSNYNSIQSEMSQDIIERIKKYQSSDGSATLIAGAEALLASIRSEIEKVEIIRGKMLLPFSAIQSLVQAIFSHKGIKLGRLNFGDAAAAINSDLLSAGEKQMLSFISYNGLSQDAVIFIDEPELSLHVDWQRSLFPTLLRQQASNQFMVATHSPFIYSKYADKEIIIDADRGDSEATIGG